MFLDSNKNNADDTEQLSHFQDSLVISEHPLVFFLLIIFTNV